MADFAGKKALIIGGGIGGLAAARALHVVGLQAVVFERAPEIQEVGAGISLWANALVALRRLGLENPVLAAGCAFTRGQTRDAHGCLLDEMDFAPLLDQAGASSVCIHRADLQRILFESLDAGSVQVGHECVGIDVEAGGVAARFANGHHERGDLLIGADGIHSVVRSQLFGSAPPRYAGYVAWRGIVPFEPAELPQATSLLALYRGGHAGVLRIGGGRCYWFATRNQANPDPSGASKKAEAQGFLATACAPFPALLEGTDEAALLRGAIVDRPPQWPWGRGLATLLGDAVHATTPNLGQGACQAVEDAVVLADSLRRGDSLNAGLRDYEKRRGPRAAMITRASASMGRVLQLENGVLSWLRDQSMRFGLGRGHMRSLFRKVLCEELPEL